MRRLLAELRRATISVVDEIQRWQRLKSDARGASDRFSFGVGGAEPGAEQPGAGPDGARASRPPPPFVWEGALYVEYSLEPRLVLRVDAERALGSPVLPLTTSPAARAWVSKLGPISGGTPAVALRSLGLYLALGHVKLFKKKGHRTATSSKLSPSIALHSLV